MPNRREPTPISRHLPETRTLAEGAAWFAREFVCTAGPADKSFEEQHARYSIAAVVEGSFSYRGSDGRALLNPGAILLGNAGSCFECGHDHGVGDRCISFQYAPELFCEAAARITGSERFRFPTAMLAPRGGSLRLVAMLEAIRGPAAAWDFEAVATHLLATVIELTSGTPAGNAAPSLRDEMRIGEVLGFIAAHAGDAIDIDGLAQEAGMSKFHFLRTFRRVTGTTPYRYLLSVRLRRAALQLTASSAPVTEIAYEVGFGDLSTFNAGFKAAFGVSPTGWRGQFGQALRSGTSSVRHKK